MIIRKYRCGDNAFCIKFTAQNWYEKIRIKLAAYLLKSKSCWNRYESLSFRIYNSSEYYSNEVEII